jgi:hypothetical protein
MLKLERLTEVREASKVWEPSKVAKNAHEGKNKR